MAEVKAEKGKEKGQSPEKEKQQKNQGENALTRFSEAVRRYFRETRGELRRVTWPTREESQRLTGVVIAVTIVFALFLGALDFVFSNIVGALIRLLGGI
ncbi:MAG: preprotein translocase subunit SecE [Chloroflexi bacterium]|nr:preprotein translocase subunit SecE [Chloroflexota bacterium]MBP8056111.1 preprotein translocase subunit SecE [Chloroflexota bacterium]